MDGANRPGKGGGKKWYNSKHPNVQTSKGEADANDNWRRTDPLPPSGPNTPTTNKSSQSVNQHGIELPKSANNSPTPSESMTEITSKRLMNRPIGATPAKKMTGTITRITDTNIHIQLENSKEHIVPARNIDKALRILRAKVSFDLTQEAKGPGTVSNVQLLSASVPQKQLVVNNIVGGTSPSAPSSAILISGEQQNVIEDIYNGELILREQGDIEKKMNRGRIRRYNEKGRWGIIIIEGLRDDMSPNCQLRQGGDVYFSLPDEVTGEHKLELHDLVQFEVQRKNKTDEGRQVYEAKNVRLQDTVPMIRTELSNKLQLGYSPEIIEIPPSNSTERIRSIATRSPQPNPAMNGQRRAPPYPMGTMESQQASGDTFNYAQQHGKSADDGTNNNQTASSSSAVPPKQTHLGGPGERPIGAPGQSSGMMSQQINGTSLPNQQSSQALLQQLEGLAQSAQQHQGGASGSTHKPPFQILLQKPSFVEQFDLNNIASSLVQNKPVINTGLVYNTHSPSSEASILGKNMAVLLLQHKDQLDKEDQERQMQEYHTTMTQQGTMGQSIDLSLMIPNTINSTQAQPVQNSQSGNTKGNNMQMMQNFDQNQQSGQPNQQIPPGGQMSTPPMQKMVSGGDWQQQFGTQNSAPSWYDGTNPNASGNAGQPTQQQMQAQMQNAQGQAAAQVMANALSMNHLNHQQAQQLAAAQAQVNQQQSQPMPSNQQQLQMQMLAAQQQASQHQQIQNMNNGSSNNQQSQTIPQQMLQSDQIFSGFSNFEGQPIVYYNQQSVNSEGWS